MKIVIFASIGDYNLWDELILKNEITLLKKEFSYGNPDFFVASYTPEDIFFVDPSVVYFSYFPNGIRKNFLKNLWYLWKNLYHIFSADMVVIGWWGIFYDNERQKNANPLRQWILRVWVSKFFRKKIYFFAPSIDIKNRENDALIKKIFAWAYKITLRDAKSIQYLQNLWISAQKVHDPVWFDAWNLTVPSRQLVKKVFHKWKFSLSDFSDLQVEWKKIGIALRQWYISENFMLEKQILKDLFELLEKNWATLIFLPHSFHRDSQINDQKFLGQFMTSERIMLTNMRDVYLAYTKKNVDIIFAQRLHSIILSGVYGIDIVAFSYAQKTDEVLKEYF